MIDYCCGQDSVVKWLSEYICFLPSSKDCLDGCYGCVVCFIEEFVFAVVDKHEYP